MKATGDFEVTLRPLEPYTAGEAGITLGRMSIDKQFQGDLEAQSQGEMLSVLTAVEGSAGYVAVEQVSGSLHGRSGTFALQHFGIMNAGQNRLILDVVPDSGTGDLAGISGQMSIANVAGQHSYILEYSLTEKVNPSEKNSEINPFTTAVGSARLYGEEAGQGPAVIFLHAGVADHRMWQPQLAALSDSRRTVAFDLRGFGKTTTADEPYANVEDLKAVLDDRGIERASLVGCSQGGRLAIDFALAYPQRVEKLALIAPAVSGAPPPAAFSPRVQQLEREMDIADELGDLDRINEIEAQLWLDGPQSAPGRVSGDLRDLFLNMNGIALAMPDLEQEIEPPSAYERAGELSQPTQLIWGDLDFAHVIERCQYLVETIPDAKGIEIAGAAHLPNLEQPELINSLLSKFL